MNKPLIELRWEVEHLFFDYLKGRIDETELHSKLNLIESIQRAKNFAEYKDLDEKPELWFKLFRGDTNAYSIRELINSLNNKIVHTKESMKIGISLTNEVEVYFS